MELLLYWGGWGYILSLLSLSNRPADIDAHKYAQIHVHVPLLELSF